MGKQDKAEPRTSLGCRWHFAAALAVLSLPLPLRSQEATPPQLEPIRVGLPAGSGAQDAGRVRPGTWTPVYLKLQGGPKGNPRNAYTIVLRATDAEDSQYTYSVKVPSLGAKEDAVVVGYVRPGSNSREVKVLLKTADGKTLQPTSRALGDGGQTVAPTALLVLSVGARLTNLKNALARLPARQADPRRPGQPPIDPLPEPVQPKQPEVNKEDPAPPERDDDGARRFAFVENLAQMPDQWFGYEAADVVVLTTGQEKFVTALLEDQTGRREALLEWVRRGGKLLLSVGHNHQLVSRLLEEKLPLLSGKITGTVRLDQKEPLANLHRWMQAGTLPTRTALEMVQLQPGPQTGVLVREGPVGKEQPLLVQSACGLGRVMLIGFDLDHGFFLDWSDQRRRAFWDRTLSELLQRPLQDFKASDANPLMPQQGRSDLLTDLQRGLESFEDIPVFHFGWVTLFILVYILIVGPLDYFVLKKFFKRLELTWITFPTLVLVVSVIAYVVAYRVKGDSMRINKIDLVEIDLHTSQAYGATWFSVFSPRLQKYTLGVAPAAPEWVAPLPPDKPAGPGAMLATFSTEIFHPLGSQGLFPQPYAYADNATGIDNVPIAVWATRSFTASCGAPLNGVPAIEADLKLSRPDRLPRLPQGTIKNNLSVPLQNLTLFYEGRWYSFGRLAPGEGRRLALGENEQQPKERHDWFDNEVLHPNVEEVGKLRGQVPPTFQMSHPLLKSLLFYSEATKKDRDNTGLRSFDQSWRLHQQLEVPAPVGVAARYRQEIILVGRTAPLWGPAEQVTSDGASASRLWLGELPGAVPKRPELSGSLSQETFVRVYIPVK